MAGNSKRRKDPLTYVRAHPRSHLLGRPLILFVFLIGMYIVGILVLEPATTRWLKFMGRFVLDIVPPGLAAVSAYVTLSWILWSQGLDGPDSAEARIADHLVKRLSVDTEELFERIVKDGVSAKPVKSVEFAFGSPDTNALLANSQELTIVGRFWNGAFRSSTVCDFLRAGGRITAFCPTPEDASLWKVAAFQWASGPRIRGGPTPRSRLLYSLEQLHRAADEAGVDDSRLRVHLLPWLTNYTGYWFDSAQLLFVPTEHGFHEDRRAPRFLMTLDDARLETFWLHEIEVLKQFDSESISAVLRRFSDSADR